MKQLVLPPGSRFEDRIELRGKEHHYLARVRRVVAGETLSALDGDRKLLAQVLEVGQERTLLRIVEEQAAKLPLGPELVLFPFLLKARKLDDVIRQACEAGVRTIVPVAGDHCVSRMDGEDDEAKKVSRWSAIAKEAAQQSGNQRVTEVRAPISSRAISDSWKAEGPLLFFHQVPLDKGSLHRYLFPRPTAVGLVVGPEGGLSRTEVEALRAGGALPVWLGPFVLRAESASLYAVAAVNTILQETSEWTIPS